MLWKTTFAAPMNTPLAQQHVMDVPLPRNVLKWGKFGRCAVGPQPACFFRTKVFFRMIILTGVCPTTKENCIDNFWKQKFHGCTKLDLSPYQGWSMSSPVNVTRAESAPRQSRCGWCVSGQCSDPQIVEVWSIAGRAGCNTFLEVECCA